MDQVDPMVDQVDPMHDQVDQMDIVDQTVDTLTESMESLLREKDTNSIASDILKKDRVKLLERIRLKEIEGHELINAKNNINTLQNKINSDRSAIKNMLTQIQHAKQLKILDTNILKAQIELLLLNIRHYGQYILTEATFPRNVTLDHISKCNIEYHIGHEGPNKTFIPCLTNCTCKQTNTPSYIIFNKVTKSKSKGTDENRMAKITSLESHITILELERIKLLIAINRDYGINPAQLPKGITIDSFYNNRITWFHGHNIGTSIVPKYVHCTVGCTYHHTHEPLIVFQKRDFK